MDGNLKKMAPINPMGRSSKGGEYQSDMSRGPSAPSTKAVKLTSKGRTFDGPFGGKKPQS